MFKGSASQISASLLALVLGACSGGAPAENAAPAAAALVTTAAAGSITGTVRLEGTPPPPERIAMNADAYCSQQPGAMTETLTGAAGSLQNVFVYVKDGLGNLKFPVPETPIVLDQKDCVYRPHVFGIQVGQTLEIVNSDSTLHNIHAIPAHNREFNRGQSLQGMKHAHLFTSTEVMIPFRCNVHNWMTAYVGVLDHPFYAVSGADGTFELKGLPAGTYRIEAWHEKLGTQSQSVTVGRQDTRQISFSFKV